MLGYGETDTLDDWSGRLRAKPYTNLQGSAVRGVQHRHSAGSVVTCALGIQRKNLL